MRQRLQALEDLLSRVPRVGLLALAVLVLRNPLMDGNFSLWGWYLKLPLEFLLLLFAALALAAGLRAARPELENEGDHPEPPASGRKPLV